MGHTFGYGRLRTSAPESSNSAHQSGLGHVLVPRDHASKPTPDPKIANRTRKLNILG